MVRTAVVFLVCVAGVLVAGCSDRKQAAAESLPVVGAWEGFEPDGTHRITLGVYANGDYLLRITDAASGNELVYGHEGHWEAQSPAGESVIIQIEPQQNSSRAKQSIERKRYDLEFVPAGSVKVTQEDAGNRPAGAVGGRWKVKTPWGEFALFMPEHA